MTLETIGLAVAGGAVGVALVNKISDAVGGIAKPYQIKRVEKAQTEAEIESLGLRMRAAARFLNEETMKQANMENIVLQSLDLVDEGTANPDGMENDWIVNFFERARIVSDEDMQALWARILSGEANVPGSFSRKTINAMADLDKRDADLFSKLCGFGWKIDGKTTLALLRTMDEIYQVSGISADDVVRLVGLGLISPIPSSGFAPELHFSKDVVDCSYFGRKVRLRFKDDRSRSMYIGLWELTPAGLELFALCRPKPVAGFFEYIYDEWAKKGLVLEPDSSAS